jgi:hypothetical protein
VNGARSSAVSRLVAATLCFAASGGRGGRPKAAAAGLSPASNGDGLAAGFGWACGAEKSGGAGLYRGALGARLGRRPSGGGVGCGVRACGTWPGKSAEG